MAPRVRVNKEEIINASIELVRCGGESALNARDIAARLGCSTQPLFSNFDSMEELKQEIISAAADIYKKYIDEEMATGKYPPYKSSGLAYIRFAKEERELFKLLYMRDRNNDYTSDATPELTGMMIGMIQANTRLDNTTASLLHLETWAFVHGIATMIATGYFEPDRELIERMLSDAYLGLKSRLED